jgi:CTP synthase
MNQKLGKVNKEGIKMAKYIFVTGGVVSSLGKGVSASSLGVLLQARGLSIFMQKFDPYLNVDPGTMSPYQHGEVFVTEDGAETDLDLGHYERFIDVNLTRNASVSQGGIFAELLEKERKGEYLGATIQVIPHETNMIKEKVFKAAESSGADVVITEIGGTVGDIESLPFIEATRQIIQELPDDAIVIHNTLVPYLNAAKELKTKPTQHSVKELRGLGIQPDILVLRTEVPIDTHIKEKISMFSGVPSRAVIESQDAEVLYEMPLKMQAQGLDDIVCEMLSLNPKIKRADLSAWEELIERVKHPKQTVTIGFVGKYIDLKDAYISVYEALDHAGYNFECAVDVKLVQAEELTDDNVGEALAEVDGILVPGGFGDRGVEGKLKAIQYAREHKIPFLGICLGMQLATIEFARNVLGLKDANSREFTSDSKNYIVDYMADQHDELAKGGTQRLGAYEAALRPDTLAMAAYGQDVIKERHRHRYEFNNDYIAEFEAAGIIFSGRNPQTDLVEIIELKDHPWFLATQFHPEFTSRPLRPNAIFLAFIGATIAQKQAVMNEK